MTMGELCGGLDRVEKRERSVRVADALLNALAFRRQFIVNRAMHSGCVASEGQY